MDIIAKDGDYIAFIEVKGRYSYKNGFGFEAVDKKKQMILSYIAKTWLYNKNLDFNYTKCRFDIVSIDGNTIRHFKNAFSYV